MAKEVDEQVVDALTIGNVKSVGEAAAFSTANLFQHQTNQARRIDALAEASLGKVLDTFASVDPVKAVSISKLFEGEADSSITSTIAQLAASQMGAKLAQSTSGDPSLEFAKITASVSAMEGMIGGLVALLQQALKGAMTTPPTTYGGE